MKPKSAITPRQVFLFSCVGVVVVFTVGVKVGVSLPFDTLIMIKGHKKHPWLYYDKDDYFEIHILPYFTA